LHSTSPTTRLPQHLSRTLLLALAATALPLALAGCNHSAASAPPAAMQAMPVQVEPVALHPVPASDTYVATIKSRRSVTMQPQVDGNITRILVKSGQSVKAGQILLEIDPLKQAATVQTQQGLQSQQKATLDYSKAELDRQQKLFEAGIVSKQAYDQAVQAFQNAQGAYQSSAAGTVTQQRPLAYYQIRAPFAGIVGDIPVHQGDYVSPTTVLTTVDENSGLEAYIYLPTERAAQVKNGLGVDLLDTSGQTIAHTAIYFVSPEVDNGLQGILAKAPVNSTDERLRNGQLVNARVIWSTKQAATIPVLAVTRVGGQTFVYVATPKGNGYVAHQVAVNLGDSIGNDYPVLSGLNPGDKVILSGIQFLGEGAPVMPLPGGPPAKPAA
jgi:RND family efflux transporter MFP subunit